MSGDDGRTIPLVTLIPGVERHASFHQRVVLAKDLPEHGLRAGDVGVVVEHYPARDAVPEGSS